MIAAVRQLKRPLLVSNLVIGFLPLLAARFALLSSV